MRKIYNILLITVALILCVSCNDEWKDEQFKHVVSFKANIDSKGVTPIYVRYKPDGKVTYQLPLIVSGSLVNEKTFDVKVAVDPDTLKVLNQERFSSRTELFYKELSGQYFDMPETAQIAAGSSNSLIPINFSLSNLDLVEKWILPLTIKDDPADAYQVNDRKHYGKALLRIFPFNNYSGNYSATQYKAYFKGSESEPMVTEYQTAYVVDENSVFIYAGLVNEDRQDRKHYKLKIEFNDEVVNQATGAKSLTITTDNPDIHLNVKNTRGTPYYTVEEDMDATRPYLKNIYVTLEVDYDYVDYTSVPGASIEYTVKGSLTLLRKINIQIPDEDQAIEW